ncbi:MAG: T9SS type A sorting domain-containing protein [Chitinophagales bacterium]
MKSIEQTSDKGYILGGYSKSNISGDKNENNQDTSLITPDYWIIKTDSFGNIQWQNTIGGNLDDLLYSIDQTSDGGYILGGYSWSNISGDKTENSWGGSKDYWVVKLDTTGNIQWQNTIGGDSEDELYSIQQTIDGGYILGGYSASGISGDKTENCWGSWDYWPVKLDMIGNIQWQSTIGGNDDDRSYSIQQSADGGYILGGSSWSDISGNKTESSLGLIDYWIVKINNSGTIQWQNAIGGDLGDEFLSLQQTFDGGYILGGWSNSNISGDKTEDCLGHSDYWIVKLSPDTITRIAYHQSLINNLQIFPNPSSGIFQITFPNQKTNYALEVINTLGQKVFATQLETKNQKPETQLNLSFLPKGIYVLKVYDGATISSNKLIIK